MHTAALWAAITASVYTANARPLMITMRHTHYTMNHTHDTVFFKKATFSRFRILYGKSSRAQRLGFLWQVLPRSGSYWPDWAWHVGDWRLTLSCMARLGLTCWRLAIGAQLPLYGRNAAM